MRRLYLTIYVFLSFLPATAQIDTALVYDNNTIFGSLDIRISRGADHAYYLQEGRTFSFRMNENASTGTYLDMTAWDSSPYSEGNLRQRTADDDLFVMNYRLLFPENYSGDFAAGYPLIIVMHGLLEGGNCADGKCYHADESFMPNENIPPAPADPMHKLLNNDYNLIHAGLDYLEARASNGPRFPDDPRLPAAAFPGIVVFPQNLNGWDAAACEDVIRMIRLLTRKYNIDENRVYINGISHGGHGAYEVMKRAPWLFAAAVQFSAADDASLINQKATDRISRIPLWIFQGGLDKKPSPAKTQSYISAFRKAGVDVRYSLYPHLGHGTWNEALDEPDFFSWLLSKRRNDIHVDGGKAFICATTKRGARLSLPSGFKGYEWEVNGVLIPEAKSDSYLAETPGTYRGRFLHGKQTGAWSPWSEMITVSVLNPESPEVHQVGTLLLPDLNGNERAVLEAEGQWPIYAWHRDAVHLTSIPDTAKLVSLGPQLGSGTYSLNVAGYDRCPSLMSAPKRVLFNDEAALVLPDIDDFKGSSVSPSETSLFWSHAPDSRTRYEVWRRSRDVQGNYSSWVMPVITEPGIFSYRDTGLRPAVTYFYKIRAVTDSSRSDYFPAGSNTLVVTTAADHEPPTAPTNLSAANAGVNAVLLSWGASRDNSSVLRYMIMYADDSVFTESADTTFLLEGLAVNRDYSVRVTAFDHSGNVSPASNAAYVTTYMKGLYYEHSTGAWEDIAGIDWSVAEFSGTVDDFNLSPRTQEDFFNFMFDGYLFIKTSGVYQFRLTSDDGSVLSLRDSLLIENDGIHNVNTVTSPVQILESGPQRISVKYFDYNLSDTLLVEYKGPDTEDRWTRVPPEVLTSELVTSIVNPDQEKFDFVVFPNPALNKTINLKITSGDSAPLTIGVYDLAGRVIFHSHQPFEEKVDIKSFGSLEPGIYIISVGQGSRKRVRRLFVQ